MDKIEVGLYAPGAYRSKDLMVGAARLTQRAEKITCLDDLYALFFKRYKDETAMNMAQLPHNNIRCFGTITMFIVGASRRFLAQITRRRVGVTFCSGSLQYSDYSDKGQFVVPYEIMKKDFDNYGNAKLEQGYFTRNFLNSCETAMTDYKKMVEQGLNNDTAGYIAPQALRNVLIIDATPQAWLEMIRQRACKRNTDETRYVMLKCWEELEKLDPITFCPAIALPLCACAVCPERNMSCGKRYTCKSPTEIIKEEFPIIEFNKFDPLNQEEDDT